MIKRYFDAFEYANRAHYKQKRKVNGTPYISHPMAVAFTLERAGCSQDLVIAGVLHDILEDTGTTDSDLKDIFGGEVYRLVKSVTENKQLSSWEERKQNYITRIRDADPNVKILSLADKLHNLYTLQNDLSEFGRDIWLNFSANKTKQEWYYTTLLEVFKQDPTKAMELMLQEMQSLIEGIFID